MTTSAQLSMSLDDYNALLNGKKRAEDDLVKVEKELAAEKLVDPEGRIAPLNAFARDCLTIARFAVANLPPEMIRGWPYAELIRLSENIHVLPDCSTNDRDMAIDLVAFAKECEQHEIRRKSEPKPTKITAEELEEMRKRMENDPMAKLAMERMTAGHG